MQNIHPYIFLRPWDPFCPSPNGRIRKFCKRGDMVNWIQGGGGQLQHAADPLRGRARRCSDP